MKHLLPAMLLATAFLVACGGSGTKGHDGDAWVAPDTNQGVPVLDAIPCDDDGDCPTGSACSSADRICVALPPWSQTFSVQIDPDPAGPLLADQFSNLVIDPSGSLDLTLAAPVTVKGKAFHAPSGSFWTGTGATPSAPASEADYTAGRLVAVASGRVPGTQFRSETTVAGYDAARADQPMYSLRLLPNLAYQATFIPGSSLAEPLPPFVFPLQAGGDGSFDVVLPSRDAFLRLQGVVLRDAEDGQPARVVGAQVSGKVGTDRIGTSTLTDGEGVFSLVLPPNSGAVQITVSPGRDSGPFPTRTFTWEDGIDALKALYAEAPFLSLDVGLVPDVRRVSVQVFAGDGLDTTVPSARLTAIGTAGDGESTVLATTDSSGIATLSLLTGRYTLVVIPPTDSRWAMTETSLDLVAQTGDAFLVRLAARVGIAGSVTRASTGTAVAGAVVSFLTDRKNALSATSQAAATEATFEMTTGEDGTFTALLDPATYALTVEPPAGSGLPRVAYASLDLRSPRSVDVALPEGALVRGHLRNADGKALASTPLHFFFPVTQAAADATWSLGQTSFAATLQTAAECTTREDGSFDAVLPVVAKDFDGNTPGESGNGKGLADFGLPEPDVR